MTETVHAGTVDRDEALKLCETIATADDVGQAARIYASRAVKDDMQGKTLVRQLQYVAANVGTEYEREINGILNIDTGGFERGYCQICGSRDPATAHENSMVCVGCFDDVGEPEECARCGDVGYDGLRLDVIAWTERRPNRTVSDEAAKVGINPLKDEGKRVRICKGCTRHY